LLNLADGRDPLAFPEFAELFPMVEREPQVDPAAILLERFCDALIPPGNRHPFAKVGSDALGRVVSPQFGEFQDSFRIVHKSPPHLFLRRGLGSKDILADLSPGIRDAEN
jgi:hypothetical protein